MEVLCYDRSENDEASELSAEEWSDATKDVDYQDGVDSRERLFQRYQHDPRILITFSSMPEWLQEHFRRQRPSLVEEGDATFIYAYRCTAWSKDDVSRQCGRTGGWNANANCGSGKRNRFQCQCNKVYICTNHSLQILILYGGMRLELLSGWPKQPDTLKLLEKYKMKYYEKFEPRGPLMDVNFPFTRFGHGQSNDSVIPMTQEHQASFWEAISEAMNKCFNKWNMLSP